MGECPPRLTLGARWAGAPTPPPSAGPTAAHARTWHPGTASCHRYPLRLLLACAAVGRAVCHERSYGGSASGRRAAGPAAPARQGATHREEGFGGGRGGSGGGRGAQSSPPATRQLPAGRQPLMLRPPPPGAVAWRRAGGRHTHAGRFRPATSVRRSGPPVRRAAHRVVGGSAHPCVATSLTSPRTGAHRRERAPHGPWVYSGGHGRRPRRGSAGRQRCSPAGCRTRRGGRGRHRQRFRWGAAVGVARSVADTTTGATAALLPGGSPGEQR